MVVYSVVTRRATYAYATGLLLLAILLVHAAFAVPYLPTNDGPEHVLLSHIDNHFGDPDTPYADRLQPAADYAARGFMLLYTPLEDHLGWRFGLQWALAIIVLANAGGFTLLVRAAHPERWPLAFLGFPLAWTWELYMGFFPFTVGSAVGLFVLATAVAWREPGPLQRVALGAMLFVQAVCHVFTAALTGIVVGLLFLARARPGETRRELARVLMMGAPAAGILVASVYNGASQTKLPFAHRTVLLPLFLRVAEFPRLVAPGPWWRAAVAMALIGAAMLIGLVGARRRDVSSVDRIFLASGTVLILAGVLSPLHVPGWQFFGPRFIPLGVLLCIVTLPLERVHAPTLRGLVTASLLAVAALWLAASTAFHRRLAASMDDAIQALAAPVRRHGLWLPLTLRPQGDLPFDPVESEVPWLMPLRHMPALYAVAEGGLTPYSAAINSANAPFVVRETGPKAPPIPSTETYAPLVESDSFDRDPAFRRRVLDELATYGMFYEGVLVTSANPDDVALLLERGFVSDWTRRSVFIGRFVPCALDVRVPVSNEALSLDVGVGSQTIFRDEAVPAKTDDAGVVHFSLANSPCGHIWVRPHWDVRTGGAEARRYCTNAAKGGYISAFVTRTSAPVTCDGP